MAHRGPHPDSHRPPRTLLRPLAVPRHPQERTGRGGSPMAGGAAKAQRRAGAARAGAARGPCTPAATAPAMDRPTLRLPVSPLWLLGCHRDIALFPWARPGRHHPLPASPGRGTCCQRGGRGNSATLLAPDPATRVGTQPRCGTGGCATAAAGSSAGPRPLGAAQGLSWREELGPLRSRLPPGVALAASAPTPNPPGGAGAPCPAAVRARGPAPLSPPLSPLRAPGRRGDPGAAGGRVAGRGRARTAARAPAPPGGSAAPRAARDPRDTGARREVSPTPPPPPGHRVPGASASRRDVTASRPQLNRQ